ncbi:N(2)-acetyl-L-2,4-diaminobutanoate deacetylase DoeB2 [Methylomarinum vadi]|uniref:N(2)-acetyl-L-2,4-diaminobutanoate deacetylase DoeB2 n=1 Tax=Methylomarinum vadi TaxID=438855 RepID=UPI00055DE6E8|nr:N(2)-acetyl-L-2,4-diaminobutanoate deacetylase DoeB2 [Methylomarinum vadi]
MTSYWQETMEQAVTVRRQLHADPEPSWEETRTAEKIRQILTAMDIAWRPCADTGTVAWLNRSGTKAPHIALRGDIDALSIHEQSGKDWCSRQTGYMHACGHDGHTATLLATARWLKHHEQRLPGPVTLLFQPAEEGGHGAKRMIEESALEGVDEIYGWHNWPALPFGKLVCPDELVMCGNGTFVITLTGVGGHASQPELCRDPVLAAAAVVMALQQIVARRLAPQQAVVVSVTSIEAPSQPTVIPQRAVLLGSIRVPNRTSRDRANQLIREISRQTAQSYGVDCEVEILPRYDATINHPTQAARVRNLWQEEFGTDGLDRQIPLPIMASEDFHYYLQEIPGAFALIGSDDGQDHAYPCHSPHYDFNDRLIPYVTRLFARLVGAPVPPSTKGDQYEHIR